MGQAAAMRFSLRLNNDLALPQYIELAQAAEARGFHQFWVSSDLFFRSAPVILAAAALSTSRISIGSCVLNPYTMNPAEIAMLAATLNEASNGRFLLGISAGAAEFLDWIGIKHEKPLGALRESVAAIRRLLRGDRVAVSGDFLRWSDDAYLRFADQSAKPNIPIYIGGMGPRMLALAGEIADGALPLLFPPERYYPAREQVDGGLALRGGSPSFDFAACVWVSASRDRRAARYALAQKVAYYGGAMNPALLADLGLSKRDFEPVTRALIARRDEAAAIDLVTDEMLRIGVMGNAAAIIERLEPLVAHGATHLSFGPPLGPDLREALAILGEVTRHFGRANNAGE